jgi:hypothetical protein
MSRYDNIGIEHFPDGAIYFYNASKDKISYKL